MGADLSSSGPGPARPVAGIDLGGVAEALSDASGETSWWYDPATGLVEMGVSEWLADAGQTVTLLRDGKTWALITPP